MNSAGKYSDLNARMTSAAILVAVGLIGMLLGGVPFALLLTVIVCLSLWELDNMHQYNPVAALILSAAGAGAVFICLVVSGWLGLLAIFAMGCFIWISYPEDRYVVLSVFAGLILCVVTFYWVRGHLGFGVLLWLICCVIASDVGGYFAGKTFGGPKLWTRISPKKTWSGTLGGWFLAAGVGAIAAGFGMGSGHLVWLSVVIAIAAQSGDLYESAIKRRAGVKDSSDIIPGHGGLLDRFDGMIGAGVMAAVLSGLGIFQAVVQH